ncbi:MAG: hypothetical protein AAB481_05090 [Patescibacteria group bacterium]
MGEQLDGVEGKMLATTAFVLTLGTDRQPGLDVVRFSDYSVAVVDGKGNASFTTPLQEYISEQANATGAAEALLALPLDASSPPDLVQDRPFAFLRHTVVARSGMSTWEVLSQGSMTVVACKNPWGEAALERYNDGQPIYLPSIVYGGQDSGVAKGYHGQLDCGGDDKIVVLSDGGLDLLADNDLFGNFYGFSKDAAQRMVGRIASHEISDEKEYHALLERLLRPLLNEFGREYAGVLLGEKKPFTKDSCAVALGQVSLEHLAKEITDDATLVIISPGEVQ